MINLPAAILKLVSSTLLAVFTSKIDACDTDLHELGLTGNTFRAYYTVLCCLVVLGYLLSFLGFAATAVAYVRPSRDTKEMQNAVSIFKGAMIVVYDVPKLITIICLVEATDKTPGSLLVASIIISAFSKLYSGVVGVYLNDPDACIQVAGIQCICCVCPIVGLVFWANSNQCTDENGYGDSQVTCPSIEDLPCFG